MDVHVHIRLKLDYQPIRQAVHNRPQPWKLHQYSRRLTCCVHCLMEGLFEVRGIKVVVRFGEAELCDNVTRISCPRSMERQNAISPGVLFYSSAKLLQLVLDYRLEVRDLPLGEERRDCIAQMAMILVRRRSEEGIVGSESGREWSVFIELARFCIKFFEVLRIEDVQFIRCNSNDRAREKLVVMGGPH